MSTIITPEERESYKQGLQLGSDQWVIRCYEMASEAFDEEAMKLAADEMERRTYDDQAAVEVCKAAYKAGKVVGTDPKSNAGHDNPHRPGSSGPVRRSWLAGFSAGRTSIDKE